MISELKIGNFKAFGPAQTIPLRPITLVFGPNSAGKSSIIQSLLLARHAADTGRWNAHQTELGGSAVDLGGFSRYVHGHDPTREVELCFEYELARCQDCFEFRNVPLFRDCVRAEIACHVGLPDPPVGGSAPAALPEIKRFIVTIDRIPFVTISRRADGKYAVVAVNEAHPVFQDLFPTFMEEFRANCNMMSGRVAGIDDVPPAKSSISPEVEQREKEEGIGPALVQAFKQREYAFEKLELKSLGPDDRWNWDDYSLWNDPAAVFCRQEGDHYWFVAAQTLRHRIEDFIEFLTAATSTYMSRLSYLGPLRCIPPRHLVSTEDQDPNWLAGGGEAWETLRRKPEVLVQANRFLRDTLHTRYQLKCNRLSPGLDTAAIERCIKQAREKIAASETQVVRDDFASARVAEDAPVAAGKTSADADLAAALQAELNSRAERETLTELLIVDSNSSLAVSHRDVGTGISQLLPVIVNAVAARNHLIAIEQPELHLHPALQAELGDVFIESALGTNKNTFLIETHSEHLILRILRRIRETAENALPEGVMAIRPEDVCVLYVEPGKDGSRVVQLPVNAEGDFDEPWPDGFFSERAKELF